jgi:hypothetical protein
MTSAPGPHHCIGAARTATDVVFRDLHARCVAAGGNLSLAELESTHKHFLESFVSNFSVFETIHADCMHVSASTAAPIFSRDKILASLLLACTDRAARYAFSVQVAHFGQPWLEQFFDGFAQFVRESIPSNDEQRLIAAYVEAAGRMKSRLSIEAFLKQNDVQLVLRECLAVLDNAGAVDAMAAKAGIVVNNAIALRNSIAGPDLRKVTDNEVKRFLATASWQIDSALVPPPSSKVATVRW